MLNSVKNPCKLYQTKFSFGATSGIITNLGLIAGLRTGSHAKLGIIAGMLVIALADNISDSLGIHIFQESECLETREIWLSTLTNFVTRILVSLTFIFIVTAFPIDAAVIFSMIWGLSLLAVISYAIAKGREVKPFLAVVEHICIAMVVIIASNFAGQFVISKFKSL